ncbi:molybdopterin converting factor subunit 1 [Entomobacter blattae]|uniref:Molybdopterin synthase sulfur carrier subunit n=1 Tax=Entomobacter blattae TaxID=2762277 RepID=A0A7H1NSD8_9PROT|nr:molybdopterin converting factor subunit 1 [Entomobacter blattae]QNT78698.1 ThiS family protein [Entomobacter blattae]
MSNSLHILYFAWLRDKIGLESEYLTLPADIENVGDLIGWMQKREPPFSELFDDVSTIRVAVNQTFAKLEDVVRAGDEIAFFPPVTGG